MKSGLRERGKPVPERGDLLVPAQAVAETATDEAHESGGAVLQTVDETELERREPDSVQRGRAAAPSPPSRRTGR